VSVILDAINSEGPRAQRFVRVDTIIFLCLLFCTIFDKQQLFRIYPGPLLGRMISCNVQVFMALGITSVHAWLSGLK